MNRDIPLLENVLAIMQEVRALEEKREFEKGRMVNVTAHLSFTSGHSGIPSGADRVFAELSELEENHTEKVRMYVKELKRAENVINQISDITLRAFVTMVYAEHQPPQTVREVLNLSEWQFRRMRESVENAECMEKVRMANARRDMEGDKK